MPPAKKRPCRRWPFVPADRFPSYPRVAPRLRAFIQQQREHLRAELVRRREQQIESACLSKLGDAAFSLLPGLATETAFVGGSATPEDRGAAGARKRPFEELKESGSSPLESEEQGEATQAQSTEVDPRLRSPSRSPSCGAGAEGVGTQAPLQLSQETGRSAASPGVSPGAPQSPALVSLRPEVAKPDDAQAAAVDLFFPFAHRFVQPRSEQERAVRLGLLQRQLLLKRRLHARLVATLGEVERRYENLLEVSALDEREGAREAEEAEHHIHVEKQQDELEALHASMEKRRAAQRADRERKLLHERLMRQRCRERRRRAQEEEIQNVTSGAPPSILMKELTALSAFVAGGLPAVVAAAALWGGRRIQAAPDGLQTAGTLGAAEEFRDSEREFLAGSPPDAVGERLGKVVPDGLRGRTSDPEDRLCGSAPSGNSEADFSVHPVLPLASRHEATTPARAAGPQRVLLRSAPREASGPASWGAAQKGPGAHAEPDSLGTGFASGGGRGGGLGRKGLRHRGGARAAAATAAAAGGPTSNLAMLRGLGVGVGAAGAKAASVLVGYGQQKPVVKSGRGRCSMRGPGRGGAGAKRSSLMAPGSGGPAGKGAPVPGGAASPDGAAASFAPGIAGAALSPLMQAAGAPSSWNSVGVPGNGGVQSSQQILLPAGLTASHLAAFNANAAALQQG
ncbi:hypothetical protein TGPRC2_299250A, partial [Toxoplasma gondii TgCatPRC2]